MSLMAISPSESVSSMSAPVFGSSATLDTRAVLKAALAGTFDLTAAQLERVFPGSAALTAASVMS